MANRILFGPRRYTRPNLVRSPQRVVYYGTKKINAFTLSTPWFDNLELSREAIVSRLSFRFGRNPHRCTHTSCSLNDFPGCTHRGECTQKWCIHFPHWSSLPPTCITTRHHTPLFSFRDQSYHGVYPFDTAYILCNFSIHIKPVFE